MWAVVYIAKLRRYGIMLTKTAKKTKFQIIETTNSYNKAAQILKTAKEQAEQHIHHNDTK